MFVSAVKEAIEDYHRYKDDQRNNKEVHKVIKDSTLVEVESQHISAGDIVYVEKGKRFPSDLILLSSSTEGGICYVQTANLDG
jgi:P-type E1-E2 ATPase